MKRSTFIKNLDITNAWIFKVNKNNYTVRYDRILLGPNHKGHLYKTFGELFKAKIEDTTIGELVDQLEEMDLNVRYHLDLVTVDENNDVFSTID